MINEKSNASEVLPMGRMDTALEMGSKGFLDEASRELLWCWDYGHIIDPCFAPVRHSFLVAYLSKLARQHALTLSEIKQRLDTLLKLSGELSAASSLRKDIADLQQIVSSATTAGSAESGS